MIGSIKYFVNEHQTLIVGIISVLAICFLCWWLFCKSKSTERKIKGSGSGWLVVKCDEGRVGEKYFCMGMWVKDVGLPFFVLSEIGVNWIHETVIFGEYRNYKQKFMEIIKKILDGVYSAVVGEAKTKRGRPIQRIFPNLKDEEISEKVNYNGFSEINTSGADVKMLFNLSSYLNDGKEAQDVLKEYKKMVEYIQEKGKGFVRKVVFIGQPAYNTLTAANVGAKVFEGDELHRVVYSENRVDGVKGESNDLYKTIKERIRNWFNDGKGMYNIAYKGYVDTTDGRIILHEPDVVQDRNAKSFKRKPLNLDGCGESRTNGLQHWEIADIYPAHKVILMIMFLIILYSNDDKLEIDIEEYKKMLAAYILVAQLFNSFCASFMNSTYNNDIGNSYVYIYDGVGANDETPVFNMERLGNLDTIFLGDSVAKKIRSGKDVGYLTKNWSHEQKKVLSDGLSENLKESQERYFDDGEGFTFFCVVMPQLDSTRDVRFPQHIGFVADVSFDGRGVEGSTIFVSRTKFKQRPRENEYFLLFKVNNRSLRDCLGNSRVVEGSEDEVGLGEYEREIILEIKDEGLEKTEVWVGTKFGLSRSQGEFKSVGMSCMGIFKSLLFENVRYSYEDLMILMDTWRRENGKVTGIGNGSLDTEFLDRLTEFYNQSEEKNLTDNMIEISDLCFLYSFVYVRFVYRAVNGGSEEHDIFNINSGEGSLDDVQLDSIIGELLGGSGTSIIAPKGFMDIGDPRSRLLDASVAGDEPFCILQIVKCEGESGGNKKRTSHFVAFAAGRFLDPKGKSIDEYAGYCIYRGVRLEKEQRWNRGTVVGNGNDRSGADANNSGDSLASVRGNVESERKKGDASGSTTDPARIVEVSEETTGMMARERMLRKGWERRRCDVDRQAFAGNVLQAMRNDKELRRMIMQGLREEKNKREREGGK